MKTIKCLCLGTIGLIVAPWKFDVLKMSIFALKASLLGQIFVFKASNFQGATISQDLNLSPGRGEINRCRHQNEATGFRVQAN